MEAITCNELMNVNGGMNRRGHGGGGHSGFGEYNRYRRKRARKTRRSYARAAWSGVRGAGKAISWYLTGKALF